MPHTLTFTDQHAREIKDHLSKVTDDAFLVSSYHPFNHNSNTDTFSAFDPDNDFSEFTPTMDEIPGVDVEAAGAAGAAGDAGVGNAGNDTRENDDGRDDGGGNFNGNDDPPGEPHKQEEMQEWISWGKLQEWI